MRETRGRSLTRRAFMLAAGLLAAGGSLALASCGKDKRGRGDDDVDDPQAGVVRDNPAVEYFPPRDRDDWDTADPVRLGWDARRLDELLAYAGEHNSRGLVVLYRGRIIIERYWAGADVHSAGDIASAQKSVTSMLVGIAQNAGLLRIADPVARYLGEGWSNATPSAEAKITVRHLLTMTSGLEEGLQYEADAGSAWYYNNPAYHAVKTVVEKASGHSIDDFSRDNLFTPIGVRDSRWQLRPFMLQPLGARDAAAGVAPIPMSGLVSSTRDMARFGLLALNDGSWDGQQVVKDRAYLADSVNSSQSLNPSYGYLWWLNGKGSYVLPGRGASGRGPLVPPAPADMFMALGAGDKKIYVAKSMGLVVARHGEAAGVSRAAALSSFDSELWQRVMAAAPR